MMWWLLESLGVVCPRSEHGLEQYGAPKLVTISYERSIWYRPYVEGGKYGRAWQERCQSDTKSNTPWSIKGTRRPPLSSPYRLHYTYCHHCGLETINSSCNQRLQLRTAPSNISRHVIRVAIILSPYVILVISNICCSRSSVYWSCLSSLFLCYLFSTASSFASAPTPAICMSLDLATVCCCTRLQRGCLLLLHMLTSCRLSAVQFEY